MPSSASSIAAVNPGTGPSPAKGGGGGGSISGALTAHITNPVGAHHASAISYAGGPTWADGTTNPASDVESQLDKILTDLGAGTGAEKIHYNGGSAWADSTTNPATTLGLQVNKIINDLNSTTGGGSDKIGSKAITHATVTINASTLYNQLNSISQASGVQYAGGGAWADGITNPATDVEAQLDKIITDLSSTSVGGSNKIGSKAIVNTSFTIASGQLYAQLQAMTLSANTQYNAGPTWLGGRTNPATTVQLQLDKIVNDLGATTASDDGAERIGAAATSGTEIGTGSVSSQIQALATNWGKLSRANTWSATQSVEGSAGTAALQTVTVPASGNRNLLWDVRYTSAPSTVHLRWYNDRVANGTSLTFNAAWDGTSLWAADDTTNSATKFSWAENLFRIRRKAVTTSTWSDASFDDIESTMSSTFLKLGDTGGIGGVNATILVYNGQLEMLNPDQTVGGSNVPAIQGVINTLKAKNTIKSWGRIVNINGGSITIGSTEGFNVNTTPTRTGTTISVAYTSAMNSTPAVIIGPTETGTNPQIPKLTANSSSGFTVEFQDGTGSIWAPTTNNLTFSFMALAEQT